MMRGNPLFKKTQEGNVFSSYRIYRTLGGIVLKIKIKENGFWQYALYALFGGVAALGFAPFYQWWCTLIGIGGAYWLTVRNKNSCGFWKSILHVAPFGAVYALSMFWWVLNSIYVVPELTSKFAIWTTPPRHHLLTLFLIFKTP